jgi:HEAT repeat protein
MGHGRTGGSTQGGGSVSHAVSQRGSQPVSQPGPRVEVSAEGGATRAGARAPTSVSDIADPVAAERIHLLEWRIEQLESALADRERLLQEQRIGLAESARREADAARRIGELEERLADARREAVTLGDRSACADAARGELEERLQEFGRTSVQAARLASDLMWEREQRSAAQSALEAARERIAILESGRERFFAKLIHWQQISGERANPELAEFIAELRSEISRLSSDNAALAERERCLRSQLEALRSGREDVAVAPPAPVQPPAEPAVHALLSTLAHVETSVAAAPPPPRPSSPETPPGGVRSNLGELRAHLRAALAGSARAHSGEMLLTELFGANAALRRAAARSLLQLAGADAAPALSLALHAAVESQERVALLDLLARTGSPLVRAALERAQAEGDPRVRAAALDALVIYERSDPDRLRAVLERALADESSTVRRRAVVALCAIPRSDFSSLLVAALRDPDPGMRRAACAALSDARAPELRRALIGALLDREASVRRAAAGALAPSLGSVVLTLVDRPEAERRRAVARLRERAEELREELDRPDRASATRLFGLEHRARRSSEPAIRPPLGVRKIR